MTNLCAFCWSQSYIHATYLNIESIHANCYEANYKNQIKNFEHFLYLSLCNGWVAKIEHYSGLNLIMRVYFEHVCYQGRFKVETVKLLDISAIDIIPPTPLGKTALPLTTDELWTIPPSDTCQVLFASESSSGSFFSCEGYI